MTRAMKICIGIIIVVSLAFYFNIINFTVDGKEVDAITGIDNIFGLFVGYLFAILFFKILGFPLIVLILLVGSITFTFYFRFINIRGFLHSIDIIKGKYDNPEDTGQISHFQALTSALSATIGLGNIAGVAVAVSLGGPGAVFWMIFIAFFSMSAKFVSCTLGQLFRKVNDDGSISGGPMYYLEKGLGERNEDGWIINKGGYKSFGKVLGILYAIFIIGGAFGGGNMFKVNQSLEIISSKINFFSTELFIDTNGNDSWDEGEEFTDKGNGMWDEGEEFTDSNNNSLWDSGEKFTDKGNGLWDDRRSNGIYYGILLVILVGLVIVGGIKRIGQVTEKIVPSMVIIYVAASLYIIFSNYTEIPNVIRSIFSQAFYPDAIYGGFLGILVVGIKRAVFSNEGGVGSASIAHSAAKTDEPVREGIVAMIGPFIDTIVVCLMTATVILITADKNPIYQNLIAQNTTATLGASMTSAAFGSVISWFPWILMIVVFLFSYSTMISWYYYGDKGWKYLFGDSTLYIYKIVFLGAILLGSIAKLGNVLDFSDLMILSCAVPNIIGALFLLPKLKIHLDDYWSRYQAGKFQTFK